MSDEYTDLIRRREIYRKAEEDILIGGQAVGDDGMNLTRADLGKVIAKLDQLDAQISAYNYVGMSNRAGFGNPS